MDKASVLQLLVAACSGGLGSTVWLTWLRPKVSKVDEAEMLSRISTAIREEIREENAELRERMNYMIDSITTLVDLLDDLFPKITGLTHEERIALRYRMNQARKRNS